jgi:hypothetical protein
MKKITTHHTRSDSGVTVHLQEFAGLPSQRLAIVRRYLLNPRQRVASPELADGLKVERPPQMEHPPRQHHAVNGLPMCPIVGWLADADQIPRGVFTVGVAMQDVVDLCLSVTTTARTERLKLAPLHRVNVGSDGRRIR